jgi:hypothetical protein
VAHGVDRGLQRAKAADEHHARRVAAGSHGAQQVEA